MWKKLLVTAVSFIVILILTASGYYYTRYRWSTKNDPAKWEEDILAIEARSKSQPVELKPAIFIGSSTIRRWESVASDMAPLPVLNHGFGGSRIQDSTYYVERLIVPYNPSMVVLYAGDNDIYFSDLISQKPDTVQRCFADFKAFTEAVHKELPRLKIYYISIKPSLARDKYWPRMLETNTLIKEFCNTDERLEYIDIAGPMLSDGGIPKKEHFADDGLHLSQHGYQLWSEIIKPVLLRGNSVIN